MKTILKRMCRMCSCHKNEEEDNGCSRDHHADEGLGQDTTTGLDRIKAQWQTARDSVREVLLMCMEPFM